MAYKNLFDVENENGSTTKIDSKKENEKCIKAKL